MSQSTVPAVRSMPGVSWAGIVAGPLGWGAGFFISYVLVPWRCASGFNVTPLLSLAGILVAVAGGFLSYRALQSEDLGSEPPRTARTRRFLALIGIGMAALFTAVMLMQGLAGLMFDGCER